MAENGNEPAHDPRAVGARRWVRRHALVYGGVNAALLAVWLGAGGPMWFLFPLVVWGGALAMHHFYVKGVYLDDDWAERRAARLQRGSYDVFHIDQIVSAPHGASRLGSEPENETKTPERGT